MKIKHLFLISFLSLTQLVSGQVDSVHSLPFFHFSLDLGGFQGSSPLTEKKVYGSTVSTHLALGRSVKFNVGGTLVNLDTTYHNVDSLPTRVNRFEIGITGEQTLPNSSIYLKGGYFLPLSGDQGHRVMGQVGYEFTRAVKIYLQTSKTFDKSRTINGNIFAFGICLST